MSKICSVCGVTYADALVFCPADGTTLRSADLREDLVGSVIADRYLVTDVLGEGGMGTVYLARHVRLPQQAAIKVLRKEMLQDASAVARFNREAANASRIDHDRVARVYDFGETDNGVVYLAMEYVPGQTLKKILTEGGPMAPARAAAVTRQIAEGLDAAHRMGIVHRDLKPDNVMVIADGDTDGDGTVEERVKVVDFGIAKAFGESGGTALTKTGFVVGTPEFMSPEQLLGGSLDARSDIYALALVAYQCLTAELPFATNTPDHGMAARLVTPPRPLTAVRPSVRWPRQVQSVLDQALSRDPADRPASAGAFARALGAAIEAWQEEEAGGRAPRPGWATEAVPTPTVPNGADVSAATLAGVAPAVGSYAPPAGALGTSAAPAYTPPTPTPTTASDSRRRGLIVGGVLAVALLGGTAAGVMLMHKPATAVVDSSATKSDSAPVVKADSARHDSTPPKVDATPVAVVKHDSVAPRPDAPRPDAGQRPPRGADPAPVPERAPVRSAQNSAARLAIDSIAQSYDLTQGIGADQAERAARQAVPVIRGLMTSLTTADDSTWASIKLSDALVLTDDMRGACDAIRQAKRLARSPQQRRAISVREEGPLQQQCGG
ncbi:protein kinase (plasmid) [Gemmatirosa kalamazoonensis]|uniref:non-specific serine/threonine protein kinase n=1 Tax=Gemmatirosa kalamazoonensis TaxID=861299 RepID=W0RRE7_9BACT|nr:serine/threonine-protein kinase [Gemmatirosa kalamazoonensis]AHG93037.1 protein kinase [Gemmatirosa kalamazoonensis]